MAFPWAATQHGAWNRLPLRLAALSNAELVELAMIQARENPDALRIADEYVSSKRQPGPAALALSEVLQSPDLLSRILAWVSTKEHAAKAVCWTWRRGWADSLLQRRSELRFEKLQALEGTGEMVALDENRLLMAAANSVRVLDQQLDCIVSDVQIRRNAERIIINHLEVGNGSVYASCGPDFLRFQLEGFPTVQTVLASWTEERTSFYELALSPDAATLVVLYTPDDNDSYSLISVDALTLKRTGKFFDEQFRDANSPFGLAILHNEIFVGSPRGNACIHVYNVSSGQHVRTLQGDHIRPNTRAEIEMHLRSINERLYMSSMEEDGVNCIVELSPSDGSLLQTFRMDSFPFPSYPITGPDGRPITKCTWAVAEVYAMGALNDTLMVSFCASGAALDGKAIEHDVHHLLILKGV